MAKVATVQKYKASAVAEAMKLSHEDYKNIKHMDKIAMANYLNTVAVRAYQAGFEAGVKSVTGEQEAPKAKVTKKKIDPPAEPAAPEEKGQDADADN